MEVIDMISNKEKWEEFRWNVSNKARYTCDNIKRNAVKSWNVVRGASGRSNYAYRNWSIGSKNSIWSDYKSRKCDQRSQQQIDRLL